jgi:hypothetical protein
MKNSLRVLYSSAVAFLIALGVVAMGAGSEAKEPSDHVCNLPSPDQAKIDAFVRARCFEREDNGWVALEPHLSGREVDGVFYTVHGNIAVYYSPEVATWLDGELRLIEQLPDNSMIVAIEGDPASDEELRARSMVRQQEPAFDGWFWSTTPLSGGDEPSAGEFGMPTCVSCHASADIGLAFIFGRTRPEEAWTLDPSLIWPGHVPPVTRSLPQPRSQADPQFLAYFDLEDVPVEAVQSFPPKAWDHVVAGDYAGPDGTSQETFITANQCSGCHDAGQKLSNTRPNMWYPDPQPAQLAPSNPDREAYRNYSPYGEWSASINGLSGRDPVWHAQVEYERRLRPELDGFTVAACFSCHGPMAGRQLALDNGQGPVGFGFNDREFFYAGPDDLMAKYGALARDGVSCAVCHAIAAEGLGVDPDFNLDDPTAHLNLDQLNTYTALFKVPDELRFFGPYDSANDGGMVTGLGIGAELGDQIHESRLCGSCHTVIVPALEVGYELPEGIDNPFDDPEVKMSFEQTTYFEWRNSRYENEIRPQAEGITCQGCHMPAHGAHRIANIQSNRFPPVAGQKPDVQITVNEQRPFYRHVLLGINLFVFSMYEQFTGLLGAQPPASGVPEQTLNPLLNAEDWITSHVRYITADVRITRLVEEQGNLEADLEITSFAGHKFPTGAGFRRAFLQFEVLDDDDNVLWASGRINELGVLVDADGNPLPSEETPLPEESQPHHQIITSQDQVQIYEARALDSEGMLQTTVLGIFGEYKDNRILPLGWQTEYAPETQTKNLYAMEPRLPGPDNEDAPAAAPEYCNKNTDLGYHLGYDPDYCHPMQAQNGQDHLTYRVPSSEIEGWASVRVQLHYQTIPPYYLRDRFQTGQADRSLMEGPDMARLIHIGSRLNLDGTVAEDWSLRVGEAAVLAKGQPASPHLTFGEIWHKLRAWHLQ